MDKSSKLISVYLHHPDAESYEQMLKRLQRQGYRFVALDEVLAWYGDQTAFGGEKLCFISLDDGFASNLALMQVCERYQAPLTIFISTRPLDIGNFWWRYVFAKTQSHAITGHAMKLPYDEFCELVAQAERDCPLPRVAMTRKQLRQISSHPLVTIGSHMVTHTVLPQLPDDKLRLELLQSKEELEAVTGKPCIAFSYPNGSLSNRDVEAVRAVYQIAFTTEQRNPSPNDDLMLVPRIGLTCDPFRDPLKLWGVWPVIKSVLSKFKASR